MKGFSLTEILIVCVIASFALLMLGKIWGSQHHLYHWQQGLSRLQENGRFASFTLRHQIEEAGYIGCGRLGNLIIWQNQTSKPLSISHFVRGYQATGDTWQPSLPSVLPKTVLAGSDVIEVNTTKEINAALSETMSSTSKTTLTIHSQQALFQGETILISDCQHADVATIAHVSTQGVNHYKVTVQKPLGFYYQKGNFVGKVVQFFFYINDTKRRNTMGDPIYALYTFDEYGRNTELVSGVSGMSITYQVNGKKQKASNINASNVWQDVTAVQMVLSVDSIDPIISNPSAHQTDRLLHKTWPVDINLQERIAE